MDKSLVETDHSTFNLSLSFVLFCGTIDYLSLFHIEFKGDTGDENSRNDKVLGDPNKDESDAGEGKQNDENKDSGFDDEVFKHENVKDQTPQDEKRRGKNCLKFGL